MAETKCGTVKWFSAKKGYGFVTGEDGEDYFAHFSQIKMEGFEISFSGKQPVQFESWNGRNWQGACNEYPSPFGRGRGIKENKF